MIVSLGLPALPEPPELIPVYRNAWWAHQNGILSSSLILMKFEAVPYEHDCCCLFFKSDTEQEAFQGVRLYHRHSETSSK